MAIISVVSLILPGMLIDTSQVLFEVKLVPMLEQVGINFTILEILRQHLIDFVLAVLIAPRPRLENVVFVDQLLSPPLLIQGVFNFGGFREDLLNFEE